MKKVLLLTIVLLAVFLMTGCAPGPNEFAGSASDVGALAGFWMGLWHGFISLFTFIASLLNDNVAIYEVHNSGGLYDLGFLLGVMAFYGGSGGGAGRKRR
jgi:predicted small secreted protein